MKFSKKVFLIVSLILIVSALYRVSPLRDYGFAPQLAIALFSGFLFRDNKKWAFIFPLVSMILSDVMYEILYSYNLSDMKGFYGYGQILNYFFFVLVTAIGFFINKVNLTKITSAVIAGPTVFYLLSNFSVWLGNGGNQHAKTLTGLSACMVEGLPFYKNSLIGTAIFSVIFFVSYILMTQKETQKVNS